MSKSMMKIYVRVFKKKMAEGYTFNEIAEQYPRLTKEEIAEIKDAL